jgi:hypothetical protein
LRDELYGQLLASLTQGGEPIATDGDYARWVESWRLTRRGEVLPELGDERMPWAFQRRRALALLSALDLETFCKLEEVAHEEDTLKNAEEGNMVAPFNVERASAKWSQWREATIESYKLRGVISNDLQ